LKGAEFDELSTRPPLTVIVKLTVPVTGVLAESVAMTVKLYWPLVPNAGVPEMDPSELKVRPKGSGPEVGARAYVTLPVPPVATTL
jgi:hypothetical protein